MKNKAVLAFKEKTDFRKAVYDGNWRSQYNALFFKGRLVAKYTNELETYPVRLPDVGFESQTFNAINRVVDLLEKHYRDV